MTCLECGLPDPYNGGGDNVGSCDCPRKQCCGAAPLEDCDCYWADDDDDFDWYEHTDGQPRIETIAVIGCVL